MVRFQSVTLDNESVETSVHTTDSLIITSYCERALLEASSPPLRGEKAAK